MKKYACLLIFFLFITNVFSQSSDFYKSQALEIAEKARNLAASAAKTALESAAASSTNAENKRVLQEGVYATVSPKKPVTPLPWNLILYRPENSQGLNDVRCWVKILDAETKEEVTYSKISATYEWVSLTKKIHADRSELWGMLAPHNTAVAWPYQRTYYLSGGMAMHLRLPEGKYLISVSTPADQRGFFEFETENKGTWNSNEYYYDTDYPATVLFVTPTANDNGFYNGGWVVSFEAPKWFKAAIPIMEE